MSLYSLAAGLFESIDAAAKSNANQATWIRPGRPSEGLAMVANRRRERLNKQSLSRGGGEQEWDEVPLWLQGDGDSVRGDAADDYRTPTIELLEGCLQDVQLVGGPAVESVLHRRMMLYACVSISLSVFDTLTVCY